MGRPEVPIELGPIVAIYVVPEDYDGEKRQEPCVVIKMLGGPKPYARFWPRGDGRIEWGWVLPETAIKVATGTVPA